MNERRCFEALEGTLKDILDNSNALFGGKPIMLGGDFRQTLPVIKSASRDTIIAASIAVLSMATLQGFFLARKHETP